LEPLVDRLPDRDRMLIRGDLGDRLTNQGNLDPLPGFAILDTLTRRYPDDVEGWVALGERYYHDRGPALLPTSTYRGAFTRALRLNPYYREPYLHLIEDAFFRLDSVGARRLIEEHAAIDRDQTGCSIRLTYDLVWGSEAAVERALRALDTIPPSAIWSGCLPTIGPVPLSPRVMDRLGAMYRMVADTATTRRPVSQAFVNLRFRMLAPRGRGAELQRELAELEGVTGPSWWAEWGQIFLYLSGFPDSAAAHRAATTMMTTAPPGGRFAIGMLAVTERRWADADQHGAALIRQADDLTTMGDTVLANAAKSYAAALRAYMGLVRGDRGRLMELELVLRQLPRTTDLSHAYLRYRVGQLLFEWGRLHDAERYFLSFGPIDFYTSQAELYLGRIREALGRPAEAMEHYRRFITWWQYADPSLRPPLEEARAALRRLTRGEDN
jgi:hypothetical protein